MKKLVPVSLLLAILFYVIACNTTHQISSDVQRAHNPWVFRSVLDAKARMLTLALHDNLWVAYSANDGNFYKAWKGGAKGITTFRAAGKRYGILNEVKDKHFHYRKNVLKYLKNQI